MPLATVCILVHRDVWIVYKVLKGPQRILVCWLLDVRCYMNLWGVAVPELDSHLDRNKGPDHAPCTVP